MICKSNLHLTPLCSLCFCHPLSASLTIYPFLFHHHCLSFSSEYFTLPKWKVICTCSSYRNRYMTFVFKGYINRYMTYMLDFVFVLHYWSIYLAHYYIYKNILLSSFLIFNFFFSKKKKNFKVYVLWTCNYFSIFLLTTYMYMQGKIIMWFQRISSRNFKAWLGPDKRQVWSFDWLIS